MNRTHRIVSWGLGFASAGAFVIAASAMPGETPNLDPQPRLQQQQQQDPDPPGGGRQGAGRGGQAPRPYAQVITSAARTDEGVFKVHRVGETLYYEIPQAELGKDFLWSTAIKKTTIGAGFGGQNVGNRVVSWTKRGDRILLLNKDFSVYADPSLPVAMAVDDSNYPGIIRSLPVAAYSPSGDAVIDVTDLFMTDVAEFSARGAVGGGNPDRNRSFLEKAVALPDNINVEVTMTYTAGGGAAAPAGGGRGGGGRSGMRGPSGTVVVHHSMVRLPERPMMQRYFDERVGYVTQALTDYGTDQHRSVAKRYIQRYRLEKKDPAAAVSDPIKPITFYIDPATPKAFVPYVKRGVAEWAAAFEAAGFRNAIVALDAPANDPEWSGEDARYSMIRWVPSADDGAALLIDPRSGEILASNVDVYPHAANFSPQTYFVQAGAADKRAQALPLPEALQGELIRYFVAHQVGHALGLQHNRKAASAFTVEQIRDPKFVKSMGFTPTIMDESRFHYVAQPGDGLDPADLIPRVGAYDRFAIRWGYAPVPTAKTPDAEKATLNQWAREQDKEAHLRFSTEGQLNTDPGDNPEGVGMSDPVKATGLGLKNLAIVTDMMLKATSTKTGDPWDELEQVYGRMINQWSTEMGHVVRVVGGLDSQQQHIGQGDGIRFRTIPRARQIEAVQFLLQNAFTTPTFMIKPEILRRIQAAGVVDRIRAAQVGVLTNLLQNVRLDRMTEQVTLDGATAYSPLQLLMDVRTGLWSEIDKPGTAITLYRRNVQRAYLDQMDQKLNGAPTTPPVAPASAEIRALVKGELRTLDKQIQSALNATTDEATRRHLVDARDMISIILDPTVPRPAPAAGGDGGGRGRGGFGVSFAQDPPTPPQQDPPDTGRGGGRQGGAPAPRPYAQVITSAAKTDEGIFKVHRLTSGGNDTLFYEIPKSELGKDFLWNTQIKKNTIGAGYGGQNVGSRVVRWVTKGDRVLLLNVDYTMVTNPNNPLSDVANYPAIIRVFPVAAYSPAGDPVIDVTAMFTTQVPPEFSAGGGRGGGGGGGRGADAQRTFLERAIAFPENINVEVTMTSTGGGGAEGAAPPVPGGRGGGRGNPSVTLLIHHSMVKLPEKPMMPRLFDERVGYFTQGVIDYGTGEQTPSATRYIARYRLEKKDPNAEMSEPVKPIIYWVDPATPKKFVPYVIKGVEDWQAAFEAAGFKNAIIAKEAPPNDPEWSPEDARYSVIRWLPSTTENASGPHIHDPRSGEILEADIQYYHNVQNLAKNWYFVQASPNDPRAQKLPLTEELMGELMRYVVAHEVGHTLGFQHNMKASSTYTIQQVRDPKFVKENGHTPTLMDYSRFNYVAQPEDKIDPADLIPKIGPYDKWATMWGYKPIPGAKTPEEEKPTLDKWAREQDEKPYLRFSTEGQGGTDPGDNTEAVGDGDAVEATRLGLRNLARVSETLLTATTTQPGDPWDELEQVYGRMASQWTTELNHVVRIIGGVESQQKHIGQQGVRFTTVARARQVEALQFLLQNAFTPPAILIRPEILRRIQPTGIIDRVRTAQAGVMGQLLQAARLDRMAEQATIDGAAAYSPLDFLTDLRAGVWSELAKPGTAINVYRRNVQRAYLDNMDARLNGGSSDEVRALVKGELRALDAQLQSALGGASDEVTRRHLSDCRDEIAAILNPRVPRPAAGPGAGFGGRGGGAGR